ncbi:MAG: TM2 domain-containing protein [bacterium]|nr:TM2 domain-containing protein [bacterium]
MKMNNEMSNNLSIRTTRSRMTAALLAILLGGIGVHKFYLGKVGCGIVYFVFSWTGIPLFLGIIEGILYLCMSDESFRNKYA